MKRLFAATLVAATALTGAASGDSAPGLHAEIDILPGWRTEEGVHMAALRISLDEGWKTYWRAPGEAGLPPMFDWSGSENVGAVAFHWPVPEIITSNGVTTLGYAGELVLPIEIRAADPGADVTLAAGIAFGICEEVCMPLQTDISAVLPSAGAEADPRILGAMAARPDTALEAGVAGAECTVEPIADGMRVTANIEMPAVGPAEFVVVESSDRSIWVSQAIVRREAGMLMAEADLVPPDAKPFDLDPRDLRITVLAGGRGVDIKGCDAAG